MCIENLDVVVGDFSIDEITTMRAVSELGVNTYQIYAVAEGNPLDYPVQLSVNTFTLFIRPMGLSDLGVLSETDITDIIEQVRKLHQAGYAHNDLRLNNIKRYSYSVALLGFGKAKKITGYDIDNDLAFLRGISCGLPVEHPYRVLLDSYDIDAWFYQIAN